MSGLHTGQVLSERHLTQTHKYGHRVTFVAISQYIIKLVFTQDKPELRGDTKRPSVTQNQADLT